MFPILDRNLWAAHRLWYGVLEVKATETFVLVMTRVEVNAVLIHIKENSPSLRCLRLTTSATQHNGVK